LPLTVGFNTLCCAQELPIKKKIKTSFYTYWFKDKRYKSVNNILSMRANSYVINENVEIASVNQEIIFKSTDFITIKETVRTNDPEEYNDCEIEPLYFTISLKKRIIISDSLIFINDDFLKLLHAELERLSPTPGIPDSVRAGSELCISDNHLAVLHDGLYIFCNYQRPPGTRYTRLFFNKLDFVKFSKFLKPGINDKTFLNSYK
jgi:hypothetical protein